MQTFQRENLNVLERLVCNGVNLFNVGPSSYSVRSGNFPLEIELTPLNLPHVDPAYAREGPLNCRIYFLGAVHDFGVCDNVSDAYMHLRNTMIHEGIPTGVVIIASSALSGSDITELTDIIKRLGIRDVAYSSQCVKSDSVLSKSALKRFYS